MTHRQHRLLQRTALAVVGVLMLTTSGAYAAYRYYTGRITRIDVSSLGQAGGPTATSPSAAPVATGSYFLLAGSDTRDVSDGSTFGGAAVGGQRADTVMLVHIPAGSAKATVMSFPRDAYVTIPAYTGSSGTVAAHKAKLNEAYAVGGATLLVSTIEQLTGLPVDHYLEVNFDGFRNIVSAVGGVSLCVTTSRSDSDSGDYLTAGLHPNVSGDAALAFVRDRKGLPAGDLSRIQDQQYFLSQLMKKVLSAGTLTNPIRLASLMSAVTGSLTVDKAFGLAQFRALATHLSSLSSSSVTFVHVPVTTAAGWRDIHGVRQSVVLLDEARLPAALAVVAGTATGAASPSASPTTTRAPGTAASTPTQTTTAAATNCAP